MVDFQTQMSATSKNGKAKPGPVAGFATQAASVAGTAMELAELQVQLVKADAKQAASDATSSVAIIFAGACALLGALPVVVLGLASMLDELTGLNAWQSQLIVGFCVVALAAIVILTTLRSLQKMSSQFERSRRELAENIAWLKSVMSSSSRPSHSKESVRS